MSEASNLIVDEAFSDVYTKLSETSTNLNNSSSRSIVEITRALVKAQKQMKSASKDSKGYGYNYSDLATVIEAVKDPLNNNGIAFTFRRADTGDGQVIVCTTLLHESGEFITSTAAGKPVEMKGCNELQRAGATESYLKRYTLQGLCGLPTEDNDASSEGFKQTTTKKEVKTNESTGTKSTNSFRRAGNRSKATTSGGDDI